MGNNLSISRVYKRLSLSLVTEKEAKLEEGVDQKIMKKRRIKCSKYAPIFKWLPKYNQYKAVGDFIAGITIGLTMIPQSIAYASLAGLDPQVIKFIKAMSNQRKKIFLII